MWPLTRKSKEDERLFRNPQPLRLPVYGSCELLKLDFAEFPLVEDFTIKLTEAGRFGLHLYFYSPTLGRLCSFPWWDNVDKDLRGYTRRDIPVGDLEEPIAPFDDGEQGWQILIFEREDFVYVLEGEEICCTEYPVWFRVHREKYLSEWLELIRQFNPEVS